MTKVLQTVLIIFLVVSSAAPAALGYDVTGSITAKIHYTRHSHSTSPGGPVFDTSEDHRFMLVQTFDQGRNGEVRSRSAVRGSIEDLVQTRTTGGCSEKHETGRRSMPETVLPVVQDEGPRLELSEQRLFTSNPQEPVPVKINIRLASAGIKQKVLTVTNSTRFTGGGPNCGVSPSPDNVQHHEPWINGFGITLPGTLEPPFAETIHVAGTYDFAALDNDLRRLLDTSGPNTTFAIEGTVEVDLEISRLPVAVPSITPQAGVSLPDGTGTAVRGDLFRFDAGASQGDFEEAQWKITYGNSCTEPEVLKIPPGILTTLAGFTALPSAPSGDMRNPADRFAAAMILPIRDSETEPGRMVRVTPVLCGLRARLYLRETVPGAVSSVSDEVRVEVMPRRPWETTLSYRWVDNHDPVEVTKFIPSKAALESPAVTEDTLVDFDSYAALGKSVDDRGTDFYAVNTPKLCLFPDFAGKPATVASWDDVCGRLYSGEIAYAPTIQATFGLYHDMDLSYVVDANDLDPDPGINLGPAIERLGEDGPFSGLYYFKTPPAKLFDTVGIPSRDFRVLVYPEAGVSDAQLAERRQYVRYVKVHEFMHSYFRDKLFKLLRQPDTATGGHSSAPLMEGLYEPTRIVEQMMDTDPYRLMDRAIAVYVEAFALAGGGFDHEQMSNWTIWIKPGERAVVEGLQGEIDLRETIASFPDKFELWSDFDLDGTIDTKTQTNRFASPAP